MSQKLTQKQEDFCLAYIETGNATEAYRRAYKPKTANQNSLWRMANRILDNVKVKSRIEELREPARKKAMLTLEDHLSKLQELRDLAVQKENYNAAITAEHKRGLAAGLYVEKRELTGKGGSPLIPGGLPQLYAALHGAQKEKAGDV